MERHGDEGHENDDYDIATQRLKRWRSFSHDKTFNTKNMGKILLADVHGNSENQFCFMIKTRKMHQAGHE